MKQITVYGLLSKIYNYNGNISMPKKICFCGYDYYWDEDFEDYIRTDDKKQLTMSFLENHADNLQCFLQDTVDILDDEVEKNNDILRIDDLIPPVGENMYKIWQQTIKNHNKINQIIDVINEMKKGE